MTSKKTALYDQHLALGAHMVEFASTWLPVRYQSEKEEHLAVRHEMGIFDVSHMGQFLIKGANASAFLHQVMSSDVHSLREHQAQYALMLKSDGGIIDDLIIYRLSSNSYLLCVNAANISKDFAHLLSLAAQMPDVTLENLSKDYCLLALQGKKAIPFLKELVSSPLPDRYFIREMQFNNITALVARTGYTGEDGVEIFVLEPSAEELWQFLLEKASGQLRPCGLAARDSLRLEAGLLLYGQDMNEQTTPLEAALNFAVDMSKEDFMGKAALEEQSRRGISKKLMGFCLEEPGIARHGFKVFFDEQEIGEVTSGTLVAEKNKAIGLVYLEPEYAVVGQKVSIDIRGQKKSARILKPRSLRDV